MLATSATVFCGLQPSQPCLCETPRSIYASNACDDVSLLIQIVCLFSVCPPRGDDNFPAAAAVVAPPVYDETVLFCACVCGSQVDVCVDCRGGSIREPQSDSAAEKLPVPLFRRVGVLACSARSVECVARVLC